MFEACDDVYKRASHFVYGYIFVTLAMWKFFPLEGQEMELVFEDQQLDLKYVLWKTFRDHNNKEINEVSFSGWYKKM